MGNRGTLRTETFSYRLATIGEVMVSLELIWKYIRNVG